MTMPRLSLYRPEKGNDYKYIDKTIWEMFQIGGVDVLVHKYVGPGDQSQGTGSPSQPSYTGGIPELQIQDLLFLENRDRKYDPDVYLLRGVYNVQDIDFNLSQFGLFLQNDTIFITFHINDTVEKIGRKIIAGDVIELPHLKDDHALNDLKFALKRFYVIEEVNRAAEGFSVTWYPHLYRAKCTPLVDSQEFKQILDQVADSDNIRGNWQDSVTYYPDDVVEYQGVKYTVTAQVTGIAPPDSRYYKLADTLRDIISTYETEMQITQAVLDQAEADSPLSGYNTSIFYTVPLDEYGKVKLVTTDGSTLDASADYVTDKDGFYIDQFSNRIQNPNDPHPEETTKTNLEVLGVRTPASASMVFATPTKDGYPSYHEDGVTPNGAPFTSGITFPGMPVEGQFCLRTDYFPKRLFRYDGRRWVKYEDNVRMTMSQNGTDSSDPRLNQIGTFVNNTRVNTIGGKQVPEKQSLSKALRPKADE
jgi:hypothetical protein